ncbi:hypothetical protein [Thermococcus paralvinellae]|uniref:hypothetical protein n=1 Tax=Thermococcus paralvinellae TaxID=582419 RepID=UPI0005B26E00|nr:hypothetical protein [Thermococcus paralvinellae]
MYVNEEIKVRPAITNFKVPTAVLVGTFRKVRIEKIIKLPPLIIEPRNPPPKLNAVMMISLYSMWVIWSVDI